MTSPKCHDRGCGLASQAGCYKGWGQSSIVMVVCDLTIVHKYFQCLTLETGSQRGLLVPTILPMAAWLLRRDWGS